MDEARFAARLRKVGVNLLVDVPLRVSRAFARKGTVPVQAVLPGAQGKGARSFTQTLVPVGGGRHVLYVNGPMCRHAGVGEGDRLAVVLRPDAKSRMPPMHPALGNALRDAPRRRAEFEALTPSHRKEILRYLWALRSEAAIERNVARLMRRMAGIGR